jgi:CRISPR system Cascade subunit CasC
VLAALGDALDEEARSGLVALLTSIGKKAKKQAAADDDEVEEEEENADEAEASTAVAKPRTPHLLFLSRQEIEAVTAFARAKKEAIKKIFNQKKKADGKALDKLRKDLQEHLQTHTSKNAVDVGLFGRFVTSDEIDTVEAARQVAHGLGTQTVDVEYDYFTAVDDLGDEPGAGHLGESEYASAVMYLYACCDLEQLEKNLGARTAEGRAADDEARRLARQSLPALVRAVAQSTPKGKKNGTAPNTRAEYVEVVVRRSAPLSFVNAFLKPVVAREEGGDVMAASIARLAKHRDRVETAYSHDKDMLGRFVLCLRDVDGAAPKGSEVKSIDDLANHLAQVLDPSAKKRSR